MVETSWPTNFKGPRVPERVRRRRKTGRVKSAENKHKAFVRVRDHVCRFPLCPCARFGLFLEVSHQRHKGIGGDPTGERSVPALMVLVCNWRHKESQFSIDKHGIRWVPLTDAGANGPIAWEIDLGVFSRGTITRGTWAELARETVDAAGVMIRPRVLHNLTNTQREILEHLAHQLADRFR